MAVYECCNCDGTGFEQEYDEEQDVLILTEDICCVCEGEGVHEGCVCFARCSCECLCNAWNDVECDCRT